MEKFIMAWGMREVESLLHGIVNSNAQGMQAEARVLLVIASSWDQGWYLGSIIGRAQLLSVQLKLEICQCHWHVIRLFRFESSLESSPIIGWKPLLLTMPVRVESCSLWIHHFIITPSTLTSSNISPKIEYTMELFSLVPIPLIYRSFTF